MILDYLKLVPPFLLCHIIGWHQNFYKKVDSKFKKGAIYSVIPLDNNEFVSNLNPYSVHVQCDCISDELVKDAHNRGYQVYTYTVNNEIVLDKVIALNVDGIFTDCPDLMINWLKNRKLEYA